MSDIVEKLRHSGLPLSEEAARAIESLREEARNTKFWLDLRERQLKRNREGWIGAAEEALAGNTAKLKRRVDMSKLPMLQLVGSQDPDEAREAP